MTEKSGAVRDLQVEKHFDMFAYLAPEDVDSEFFGGKPVDDGRAKFSVAVIGVGVMGQCHIQYQTSAGCAVVRGLYDTRERSVQSARPLFEDFDAVTIYDSAEAACADPAIDAVIIASPNHTHREIFECAIRHKKHILLEKPISSTVEGAAAMVRAAEGYDRVAMVGLEYRLKPMYMQAAHEAFVRESLGEIKMISILENRNPFLNKAGQWNKFSEYSGGTLVEKCCHYFDQFNVFAGARPRRVFGSGGQAVHYRNFSYKGKQSDILDHATVIVEYENDVRATLNLCMFSKEHHEEIVILGDQGRYCGIDGEPARIQIDTRRRIPDMKQTVHWSYGGGHSGSSPAQAYLFADAVEGKTANYPGLRDGFWAVAVGAAAERSVAVGEPIDMRDFLEESGASDMWS
jgi:myo-inositol 2-dehydrogenase / D-chiro-inositol 1-dehydrogenase